jgi:iron complex outermembrane receptor protein
MAYHKILLISFLIFLGYISKSQSISGYIFDQVSEKPLKGADIYLFENKIYTTTDSIGFFHLNVSENKQYNISISYLGYKTIYEKIFPSDIKMFSLTTINHSISGISITASRSEKRIEEIAAQVDIITNQEIEIFPISNTDDILQSIANVYVNRSWGIFSKNSSVTMRGLDGTARVLVLYDGVPLNKTSGGGINWHLISPDRIEKIEVIKGPASALYGNNAMGGVINIISKDYYKKFEGKIDVFYGNFNTIGGRLNAGGKYQTGFYWKTDIFYRQGDGYIIVSELERDSTDVPLFIKEFSISGKIGYETKNSSDVNLEYNFYDDKRGEGIKVYTEEGSYLKYPSNFVKMNYKTRIKDFTFNANSFFYNQFYYQFAERLNETGDNYKIYERNQISNDYGIWLNTNKQIKDNQFVTFGVDTKIGSLNADDIYRTSSDYILRTGKIDFAGIYFQDEIDLFDNLVEFNIGARFDYARFHNGTILVENPTSETGFETGFYEEFKNSAWYEFSPKLSAKMIFENFNFYVSYSKGFMPPTLDDMCSSRKISKGFKIANPNLKPETLTNYETGIFVILFKKIEIETAIYFSQGKDFQYFVGTGDTIEIDARPIFIRENISEVEIYGTEISTKYELFRNIILKANYTYNHSVISKFDKSIYFGDDLTGKFLAEIPAHQGYAGLFWQNNIIDIGLTYNYIGELWGDEFNSFALENYSLIDLSLSKKIKKKFSISLDIQNILNKEYVDKKDGLSPGRFSVIEIGYKF